MGLKKQDFRIENDNRKKGNGPHQFGKEEAPWICVNLQAEYWRINIPKSRPGRTGDISEDGVLLYLPEKIAVGQNIGLSIFIDPDLESKSIEALCRVIGNDSHFGKKDFYHRRRRKFVDISEENMDKLKNFLNIQINLGTLKRTEGRGKRNGS